MCVSIHPWSQSKQEVWLSPYMTSRPCECMSGMECNDRECTTPTKTCVFMLVFVCVCVCVFACLYWSPIGWETGDTDTWPLGASIVHLVGKLHTIACLCSKDHYNYVWIITMCTWTRWNIKCEKRQQHCNGLIVICICSNSKELKDRSLNISPEKQLTHIVMCLWQECRNTNMENIEKQSWNVIKDNHSALISVDTQHRIVRKLNMN